MNRADTILDRIDGQHFLASDIMAVAGIKQNTLTNYLTKSPIKLCSETAGQGRARRYCLADVYQIVLLTSLSNLSGSVEWSAQALNKFLFGSKENDSDFKESVRKSIKNARKEYWIRSEAKITKNGFVNYSVSKIEENQFTVSSENVEDNEEVGPFYLLSFENSGHGFLPRKLDCVGSFHAMMLLETSSAGKGGIFLNLTARLAHVDWNLDCLLQTRGPK